MRSGSRIQSCSQCVWRGRLDGSLLARHAGESKICCSSVAFNAKQSETEAESFLKLISEAIAASGHIVTADNNTEAAAEVTSGAWKSQTI